MQQIFADKKVLEEEAKRREHMLENEKLMGNLDISNDPETMENQLDNPNNYNASKALGTDGSDGDSQDLLTQTPVNDAEIDENEENGLPVNADNKGKETFLKFLFGKDPVQNNSADSTAKSAEMATGILGKNIASGVAANIPSYKTEDDQFQSSLIKVWAILQISMTEMNLPMMKR